VVTARWCSCWRWADHATATAAAGRIFALEDRVPAIDSSSDKGRRLEAVQGHIEFKYVNGTAGIWVKEWKGC
jgi:hypothetical protein